MDELISRQATIDKYGDWYVEEGTEDGFIGTVKQLLEGLSPAQPEVKQISYTDCANAMLMMWMDKVLTDGEYNRIMDKLNEHEKKRGKDNG